MSGILSYASIRSGRFVLSIGAAAGVAFGVAAWTNASDKTVRIEHVVTPAPERGSATSIVGRGAASGISRWVERPYEPRVGR